MAGMFEPGRRIVGTVYDVIQHVATGGMGSLYEVEDTTVGRRYILKTLHPDMIDREDLVVRMQNEARALGKLHHPNIVEIITAGVTGDEPKMPFYVMERLVGENLRAVLEGRKRSGQLIGPGHAYRIGIDVLEALRHAHESALVHRDVKPENIFLHRSSNTTVTKLLDFGIVRMLNRHAFLTRGKFLGTLRYSSPEQITGMREIGPASDVYSAALVLYEMLVGRGPFDEMGDAFKVGAAHAGETPPPPSRFRSVAPEVERLILQALEKSPEARPSSAAFAAGLRLALAELQASPSTSTDVDLLAAHRAHSAPATPPDAELAVAPTLLSAGKDAAVSSSAPTITSVTANAPSTIPESKPPADAVATRLEGAGKVAVADTVAAPDTPLMSGAPTPAPHVGGLDRDAATRASPPSQPPVRTPSNDTQVGHASVSSGSGGSGSGSGSNGGVRGTVRMDGAFLAAAGVSVASAPHFAPSVPAPGLGYAAMQAPAFAPAGGGGTSQKYIPTVQVRPRKDRAFVAIVAAALVAVAMIAGAFVIVRGRFSGK